MLSDIIEVVKLLRDTLQGLSSPEKKREKLAKQVLRVYLDLDDITRRSKDILSLLHYQGQIVYDIPISLVTEQQSMISSLLLHLKDGEVEDILNIHISEWNGFMFLMSMKQDRLGFYLRYLYAADEIKQKRDAFEEAIIKERKLSRQDQGWSDNQIKSRASYDARKQEMKSAFSGYDIESYEIFLFQPGSERHLGEAHMMGIYEPMVYVFATPEHIDEAKKTVLELDKLKEEIRSIIKQQFKLEDLL